MHDPARIAELEAARDAAAAEIGAFEERYAVLKEERRLVNGAYKFREHELAEYLATGEPEPEAEPQMIEVDGHAVGADAGEVG